MIALNGAVSTAADVSADVSTEITADELLAGSALSFSVVVPAAVLRSQTKANTDGAVAPASSVTVQLRPLTIGAFQLIMKAARQDSGLIPLLMIKESLVQPALSLDQIKGMQMGLVNFLIAQIREISGLAEKKSQ